MVQEASGQGVSTRKVEDLVLVLGWEGISKSEVSWLCTEADEQMNGLLSSRKLAQARRPSHK